MIDTTDLSKAFSRLTKPTEVEGDDIYKSDLTSEEILALINTPYDDLIKSDFIGYLGVNNGGIEDLTYLLPAVLRIWQEELYVYSSFMPMCHEEFFRTQIFMKHLDEDLKEASAKFMAEAFLKRCSIESLEVTEYTSMGSLCGNFNSIGCFLDKIPDIFEILWLKNDEKYLAFNLKYISLFIYSYELDLRSIFKWETQDGYSAYSPIPHACGGFDAFWLKTNVEYIKKYVHYDFFLSFLDKTRNSCSQKKYVDVSNDILKCLTENKKEVASRCEDFLYFISTP